MMPNTAFAAIARGSGRDAGPLDSWRYAHDTIEERAELHGH